MFTGIIETTCTVLRAERKGTNVRFTFQSQLDEALRVDQSIAHNGVCLTVTDIAQNGPGLTEYAVTAIDETLKRTQLGSLQPGDLVNIERCLRAGQRLDGHFVQGHIDATGQVSVIRDMGGSWLVEFSFDPEYAHLLVPKGSICVNGVSLTVVDASVSSFTVAIIPYTWEHTNFHRFAPGTTVNLEFDIMGKYMARFMELKRG